MERQIGLSDSREWSDWAVYVIKSLEKLVLKMEQQSLEFVAFKEKLLATLATTKESLIAEMNRRKEGDKEHLEQAIRELEKMIQDICVRTQGLELQNPIDVVSLEIAKLKEETILPMRLKLALLSGFMGVVGSAVFLLVVKFLEGVVIPPLQ